MPRKKGKPPDGVAVAQPVSHLLPSVAVIHDFPGGAKGIDICPYVTASAVVIIIYYEPTVGPDLWEREDPVATDLPAVGLDSNTR